MERNLQEELLGLVVVGEEERVKGLLPLLFAVYEETPNACRCAEPDCPYLNIHDHNIDTEC